MLSLTQVRLVVSVTLHPWCYLCSVRESSYHYTSSYTYCVSCLYYIRYIDMCDICYTVAFRRKYDKLQSRLSVVYRRTYYTFTITDLYNRAQLIRTGRILDLYSLSSCTSIQPAVIIISWPISNLIKMHTHVITSLSSLHSLT